MAQKMAKNVIQIRNVAKTNYALMSPGNKSVVANKCHMLKTAAFTLEKRPLSRLYFWNPTAFCRVLERSAPRRGDPEQQSETRRAPGAALRKLRRSTTQRCTPKMAGAHLAPQWSDRYKISQSTFQKCRASREFWNTQIVSLVFVKWRATEVTEPNLTLLKSKSYYNNMHFRYE